MSAQNTQQLYPKCPISQAGVRCRNQKQHQEKGAVCHVNGVIIPLASLERCPAPTCADIQQTELVCKKHGRGVEALSIAGSTMAGQFCLACSLELLGGMMQQVSEVPKPTAPPKLAVVEEALMEMAETTDKPEVEYDVKETPPSTEPAPEWIPPEPGTEDAPEPGTDDGD